VYFKEEHSHSSGERKKYIKRGRFTTVVWQVRANKSSPWMAEEGTAIYFQRDSGRSV